MDPVCPSILHLCFVRVTRLDTLGNPVAGPNNVVVNDDPMTLTITPDVLAGEVKDQKNGCDKLAATYRGQDIVKRYNLELDLTKDQPAMEEILTGADAIVDTSANPIGVWFPSPCGTVTPFVAFEAWQDLQECDGPMSTPYAYMRWLWPAARFVKGAQTAQNDFGLPKFTGFTVGNANWGLGIYGDQPEAAGPHGGRFYDNILPNPDCSWQSQAIT